MYIYILESVLMQFLMLFISKKINYSYDKYKLSIGILVSVVVAYFIFNKYGLNLNSNIILLIFGITISSSLIDLEYQEIPDSYNATTWILVFIAMYISRNHSCSDSIFGFQLRYYETFIIGGGIIYAIFFGIVVFTGQMGGGDVKMAGGLGFLIPYIKVIPFMTTTCLVGAIFALSLMLFKRKGLNDFFPFGPCIGIGAFYTVMFLI